MDWRLLQFGYLHDFLYKGLLLTRDVLNVRLRGLEVFKWRFRLRHRVLSVHVFNLNWFLW